MQVRPSQSTSCSSPSSPLREVSTWRQYSCRKPSERQSTPLQVRTARWSICPKNYIRFTISISLPRFKYHKTAKTSIFTKTKKSTRSSLHQFSYIMSSSQINFQAEYKTIKAQYDSLLEKNQNDLIKIKQKEKQLNEELARVKEESRQVEASSGERVRALMEELESERRKNERGELTVVVSKQEERIKELEMDLRGLMDNNIALTSQNTALRDELERAKQAIDDLNAQNERQKEYILSVEQEYKQFKAKQDSKPTKDGEVQTYALSPSPEEVVILQQHLQRAQKQLQHLSAASQELKGLLKHSEEKERMLSDRQRKAMQLLKKRQQELSSVQAEVDKLKAASFGRKRKTETSESLCLKCKQLEQQIHLLKQMVKSTKGMVRVREIEAQKYRMHEDPNVRDNRSAGKLADKPSTLPPLRKKQGE